MKGLGIIKGVFIVSIALLPLLTMQSCDGSGSSNQGGSWSSKPYNRYQKEQQRQRESAERNYSAPPISNSNTSSQREVVEPAQNVKPSRSLSPDDVYDEGYENGYTQGEEDGKRGHSHGYGYDDSNDYYNHYETRYCEGYEDGYDDGYSSGYSQYEDGEDDE